MTKTPRAIQTWISSLDPTRFTHRAFARIGVGILLFATCSLYIGIRVAVAGEIPAGIGQGDLRVAWVGLATAFVVVLGNVALVLIRDVTRRKAKRASCPPHDHPEIAKEVRDLREVVEGVVDRLTETERAVARDRQNLHRKIEHVGHEVESLRGDMAAGQASQIAKIDTLTAAVRAERGDNEARARETHEMLGNIVKALGLAAKAGMDGKGEIK
jgi:hypothetical protein